MEVNPRKKYKPVEKSDALRQDLESKDPDKVNNSHITKKYFGYDKDGDASGKFSQVLNLITHVNNHGRLPSKFGKDLTDIDKILIRRYAYRAVFNLVEEVELKSNTINLSTVSYKENVHSFSPNLNKLLLFGELKIGSVFNMKPNEFLDLPDFVSDEIIEFCTNAITKESDIASRLNDKLGK